MLQPRAAVATAPSSTASPFAYLGSPSVVRGEAFARVPSTDTVEASPRPTDGARSIRPGASERFSP
jgi:hypothetical protein